MFTNWLTSTTTSTATTNAPLPDIIVEVGPPPYARYAAHSALLSAHSGYLRSAIRPDERNTLDTAGLSTVPPIYVPNVTAEQFAPLLTYMYTGFLDLNIENIFGVLLATHVLHMPRALEICRAFLARTQTEGYLGGAFLPTILNTTTETEQIANNNQTGKIVRPIASKAAGPGLSFIAAPMANILVPSHDTPFKSLLQKQERELSPVAGPSACHHPTAATAIKLLQPNVKPKDNNVVVAMNHTKRSVRKRKRLSVQVSAGDEKMVKASRHSVAEITELLSVDETIKPDDKSNNKIIIDIASCDGPVRFLRVLNDSYGRTPATGIPVHSSATIERSHQNLTTSFHVQMAKNISSQQQQHQIVAEESENSQEIFVDDNNSNPTTTAVGQQSDVGVLVSAVVPSTKSDEVYSCVYCKHTFKSQYCYQKHAKRHINPLHIDGELVVETIDSGSEKDEKGSGHSTGELRREVRPLDMNVQYYPCKTCGSKFPSYYFVHKHRKLCHANEEN